jgi:hypothetical protein
MINWGKMLGKNVDMQEFKCSNAAIINTFSRKEGGDI